MLRFLLNHLKPIHNWRSHAKGQVQKLKIEDLWQFKFSRLFLEIKIPRIWKLYRSTKQIPEHLYICIRWQSDYICIFPWMLKLIDHCAYIIFHCYIYYFMYQWLLSFLFWSLSHNEIISLSPNYIAFIINVDVYPTLGWVTLGNRWFPKFS